jgi:2-polyprenyl-3-methyl-5-hydroxy-6-metoxy-1,4-benzoquinol methylase
MSVKFTNEKQFIDWNEEMAHRYDPEAYHLRSNLLIRWIERRRVKAILSFLSSGPQDVVLEVGCGAGNVLEQIPSQRLNGIDLSASLLKKSQRRLAHCPTSLAQANGYHLPFANEKFNQLVCTEVLEHVPDSRIVVQEMARVATKDAVIVISVPNELWIDRIKGVIRFLGLGRWLLKGSGDAYNSPDQMTDAWHLHHFDLKLLQEVTAKVLTINRVKAIPFPFIPLRYVASCRINPGSLEYQEMGD